MKFERRHKRTGGLGLPSGPVVKTLLPMQGAPVRSLVRKLDPARLNKDPARRT